MEEPKKPKQKLSSKLKILLLIIGFIIVFSLISLVVSILSKPITEGVSTSFGSVNSTYYNINLTPVKINGSYISFNYPKGVPLSSRALQSPISLETFTFYTKDVHSWLLAVDVTRTPTGQLSENSGYNLRKENPGQFSENIVNINGHQFNIMTDNTDTTGYSKVAYTTHDNYIATIALSGYDAKGTEPLDTTLSMVMNNFIWK